MNDKIKLVHVIAGLTGGGRERRMVELVKGLNSNEFYEQYVILLNKAIDYPDIYKTDAKIIVIDYPSKLETAKVIFRTLKTLRPSILHLWTEIHYVLILISVLKPFLSYRLIVGFLADGNPVRKLLSRFANRLAFTMADRIVSNSKAGVIAKNAPHNKADVIYNGFSYSRFRNFPDYHKDLLKNELGIDTKYLVSMMARFNPAKDWDTFINIAHIISRQRNDVLFLAIGQGELLEHYKARVAELNLKNVKFMGFRSDIDKILFCSDICLLCTNEKVHAEGVSNSIMEAMAAGRPVIATQGGGTQEIITNNINGFIIQPCGDKEGAEIILNLISSPNKMKTIGDAAQTNIIQHFSLDNMVKRYEYLYQNLLNHRQ